MFSASPHVQKASSSTRPERSNSEISVTDGTEGRTSERVQAVDQDQCACQVLPPFGDGVPHLVKAHMKLLDYVPVAVANVGGPGQEEVVGWFPHALRMERRRRGLGEDRKKNFTSMDVDHHDCLEQS